MPDAHLMTNNRAKALTANIGKLLVKYSNKSTDKIQKCTTTQNTVSYT